MRPVAPAVAVLLASILTPFWARAELVDNPAYGAWAKFKPLSSATYEESTADGGFGGGGGVKPQIAETTYRLAGVTPDAVTIQRLISFVANGKPRTIPRGTFTIPAKIDKSSANVPPLDFSGIRETKVTDSSAGTDKVDINGTKTVVDTLDLTVTLTLDPPQVNTLHIKTWTTPIIPGGLYKVETHAHMTLRDGRDSDSNRTRTLVSFHVEP